jgi:hypothetical protein
MQIGLPGGALSQYARMLEETWKAWADETVSEKKDRLQSNVEFLFDALNRDVASLMKEWRLASPAPPEDVRYFEKP